MATSATKSAKPKIEQFKAAPAGSQAHGDVRKLARPFLGLPIDMRKHELEFDKATGT